MSLEARGREGASVQTGTRSGGGSRWKHESRVRNGGEASAGSGK